MRLDSVRPHPVAALKLANGIAFFKMPQSPSLCYKQGNASARLGSSVANGPKTTDEAEDGADVGPVVVAAATNFGKRQRRVDPDARGVES